MRRFFSYWDFLLLLCMEHDFFISLQELKETGHLSGCAQHFHRGTWNGVKLCHWRWLDAVTRAEEGPLSYSVVVGGWTSLGPTTDQTLHPSILLTSNQGLNPGNYTLWESEWQFFQRAGSAIAIFTRGGSEIGVFQGARIACRESRRCLSVGAAVLFGRGRSMEWRSANTLIGPEHNLKQCK